MLWLKTALFCVVVLEVTSKPQKVKITKDIIKAFLSEHNAARRRVRVPDLAWSNDLSKSAEKWASKCKMRYSYGENGENLYASGPKSTSYTTLAKKSVVKWVAQKKYLKSDWTCTKRCEHYTQVVWETTEKVGCAIVHCDTKKLPNFVVCQYSPPGNYEGETPF